MKKEGDMKFTTKKKRVEIVGDAIGEMMTAS
jgi:hypothetical protein